MSIRTMSGYVYMLVLLAITGNDALETKMNVYSDYIHPHVEEHIQIHCEYIRRVLQLIGQQEEEPAPGICTSMTCKSDKWVLDLLHYVAPVRDQPHLKVCTVHTYYYICWCFLLLMVVTVFYSLLETLLTSKRDKSHQDKLDEYRECTEKYDTTVDEGSI